MRALGAALVIALVAAPAAAEVDLERWNERIVSQIRAKKPRHVVISASAAAELKSAGVARLLKLVKIAPVIEDGEPAGWKVFAIRRGTVLAALGFRDGDVIDQVNGLSVRDPAAVMAAYSKLAAARRLEVRLRRAGKPVRLRIDIARR